MRVVVAAVIDDANPAPPFPVPGVETPAPPAGRRKGRRAVSTGVISTN